MLMASGANFGIRRSLPHLFGVVFGFVLMVILVGTGLIQVFEVFPQSYQLLRGFSIAYLSYLAWKIATAKPQSRGAGSAPMNFLQAALFQWVNPKAWAMALTAVSIYVPSQNLAAVVLIAFVFGLVNLPSIFLWVVIGSRLQRYLQNVVRLKVFNYTMALMLIATLYPIIFNGM
jgi:threonine/homoserine/homoserine lactone efflux protein